MTKQTGSPDNTPADLAFATLIYRRRWAFATAAIFLVSVAFGLGLERVGRFSTAVAGLADTSIGDGAVKPLAFDPSMDVWFGEHAAAVDTFYDIEDTFVAEDYVMVTFETNDDELGVFSRESLSAIARLTERALTVPGVRHVRSLTYNPWIRWGTITDDLGTEEGLIISDLIEVDPQTLTDAQIVERMVATLGAERTAARIGEQRVRDLIGQDADFAEYIGEPLLLGTILNETGTVTAVQVQVLRPHIDQESLDATFPDEADHKIASNLSSIEQQRVAVRGIEHFLRLEKGLAIPTPERAELVAWLDAMPDGEGKDALRLELDDPTRNLMANANGELVRKYFEYDPVGSGYVDSSIPSDRVKAPADFEPRELSPYSFHIAGAPLFERNFESVGLADGKYVPLMFLVITVVLFAVFRNLTGVIVPLTVVFGAIMAMVGSAFAIGNLLNNLTMMSPNMLTAVGIADAIHLVAAWALLRSDYDDKRELIIEVVRRNALPVFLTSLTTAVGFYSLTISQLVPVQMLGAMAALGTFFAWALSMTLIPALLSLVPHRKATERKRNRIECFFSQQRSERIVNAILHRRLVISGVAALLIAVSVFGVSRVTVDSDFRGMFPDDNKTMLDFNWVESRMGGVGDLEIIFTGLDSELGVSLTRADEARLTQLETRELGTATEAPDIFEALDDAEVAELAALRRRQEAIDDARIGVSIEFLAELDSFEARLREEMADPSSKLAVITDFNSPLDTLRKINQVQNRNLASYYRVPREADVPQELRRAGLTYDDWSEEWSLTPAQTGSSLVAQYYLQYESGARPGESLATRLSADRKQFRMQGRIVQASSMAHIEASRRLEEIARAEFPRLTARVAPVDGAQLASAHAAGSENSSAGTDEALASFTLSGKTLLFARTSDLFARGFVQSMALALAAITVLIGVIFRSLRFALVSLIPNVLPILLPLSVFGLLGIPLDGPSILVSSVALGVCVDDTIHFLTKFDRGRRRGLTPPQALTYVLTQSGAAMTVTTVVLIIGFSTLLMSEFSPNFQMGALAAVMIGLAWGADFIVTTAVLSFDRRGATAPAGLAAPAKQSTSAA